MFYAVGLLMLMFQLEKHTQALYCNPMNGFLIDISWDVDFLQDYKFV